MTTTFDKREEGFEKKFAHDEELRFKAIARRNKMLGLWAAGILGKSGAEAEAYAKEVVLADFEEAGDNDVMRKVLKDLQPKGITEEQVRAQMTELLAARSSRSRRAADVPAFALARRLRAGETVYAAWCMIGSPIVAETIAREGFAAVVLDAQHGLWDVASLIAGVGGVNHAEAAPIVRVPHRRFCAGVARARFRRRSDHRADDQQRRRCAPFRGSCEISTARRAELGSDPRHAVAGPHRTRRLHARGQRRDADFRDDRNRNRARQCRRHCRNARHRCPVRRPLRSRHSAERRHRAGRQAPQVEQAIDRICAAAKKAGKIPGIYCRDVEGALAMAKRGFRFVVAGNDTLHCAKRRRRN